MSASRSRSRSGCSDMASRELAALSASLEAVDYRGWDPYDALSTPAIHLVARSPLLRRAFIQTFKRSPVNVRGVLRTPVRRHSKAIAICVSAYSIMASTPFGSSYGRSATMLADALAGRVTHRGGVTGWAYDFDVQTRWGFYAGGEANAVATAFALHALVDVDQVPAARGKYVDLAAGSAQSVVDRLTVVGPTGSFFGYHVRARGVIHNANMLVAGALARIPLSADTVETARAAVDYTVSRQRPDGSWPYGEAAGLDWVDGYHTAYILMSLARWLEYHPSAEAQSALERGLTFYMDHLFEESGAPRASVTSLYPIDVHAAASAIWALTLLRHESPRAEVIADRVLRWTLANLRRPDHRYAFQLHRRYRNSTAYIRWNDAHMLLALACVAAAREGTATGEA